MPTPTPSHQQRLRCVGVGMLSVALLMTELILTRLFSVTIWYHFAFLAISVALFGVGAASLFVHLIQRRLPEGLTDGILAVAAVVLGLTIVASDLALLRVRLDWSNGAAFDLISRQTLKLLIIFVASAAPFFVGGFAISLAMTRFARSVHSLYAWDLLGAGLGCVLVIPALAIWGAPVALAWVGALAVLAGIPFALNELKQPRRILLAIIAVFAVLTGALAIGNPMTRLFDVRVAKGVDLDALNLEFNEWNSFSMVSVWEREGFHGWGVSPAYDGPIPEQKALVIDMNALTMLTRFDGDLDKVAYVSHDCSAFVYRVRPDAEEVCVIGAGGGKDVLAALASGAGHVTAVEINPLIVDDVMRGAFLDYTGGLYERDDIDVIVGDGRGVVRGSDGEFDIIQISMVDTSAATAAGAYVLSENSLYTVEAFRDYLSKIKPDGLLSVSWVSLPNLAGAARLCTLARRVADDPANSIAVVSTPWQTGVEGTLHNVMIKKGAFTTDEIDDMRATAQSMRFTPTWMPGDTPPTGDEREAWIGAILGATDDAQLNERMREWPLDVVPTTDDRPFFFYQNRLSDLGEMLKTSRPDSLFGNGLFILAKVLIVAFVMVALFLVAPFFLARRELREGSGVAGWDLAYVACLGVGFMFVEIALIQRFVLYLGRPTHTLAVVLLALLCAGGLGSRWFGLGNESTRRRRLTIVLGALVALIVALWQTGGGRALLDATVAWPETGRIALSVALIAPLGFLLGMPFPAGLAAVARRAPTRIPWLWGVNSATSVLGSVAATLVSIHAGLTATMWVGAVVYLLALVLTGRVLAFRESH